MGFTGIAVHCVKGNLIKLNSYWPINKYSTSLQLQEESGESQSSSRQMACLMEKVNYHTRMACTQKTNRFYVIIGSNAGVYISFHKTVLVGIG